MIGALLVGNAQHHEPILANAGEPVCVCDLVPALGLAQPTVSYHLKQLVGAGIISRERRGTYAYYELVPGALEQIGTLFEVPAALGR